MVYILIVLCAVFVWLFLRLEIKERYALSVVLKGMSSLCFVCIGLLCSPGTPMATKIVWGLVIGCISDVLLNLRMVFTSKAKPIFLAGIVTFLSGHIVYLAAVLPLCSRLPACVAACLVLTALLMIWIFRRITATKVFKIFGVVYIGAIMLLNCVAVSNLITRPCAFTLVFAPGALLFLLSDILLILNTFGKEPRRVLRVSNICLYYVGQILIALSLKLLA